MVSLGARELLRHVELGMKTLVIEQKLTPVIFRTCGANSGL